MRAPTYFESGVVAIFGGSFDPITYTHIQVATEVINFGFADQVYSRICVFVTHTLGLDSALRYAS